MATLDNGLDEFFTRSAVGGSIILSLPLPNYLNETMELGQITFVLFSFLVYLDSLFPILNTQAGRKHGSAPPPRESCEATDGKRCGQDERDQEYTQRWDNWVGHQAYKEEDEGSDEDELASELAWEIQQAWVLAWVESKLQVVGMGGRGCVERFICELQQYPILRHQTIVGEVLNLLLPRNSSSSKNGLMQRYREAQKVGQEPAENQDCRQVYHECPVSVFNLLKTKVK